jgi:signal transduction histidine kinase
MIGKGVPMKDRRRFQIIEGFRQSPGKSTYQRVTPTSEIFRDGNQSYSCLLRKQAGNNLIEALTASEQRLSELLQDRRRIGHELHNSVLQALYAIGMSLDQTAKSPKGLSQAGLRTRAQAADQLHILIQDIRRMILNMESDCVDPFRLVSELQALVETFEQVSGLDIRIDVAQAAEDILTGEEARELIAVTREALSNCFRHAQATHIVIALQRTDSRVRLSIRDNGIGFSVEHGQSKGIGFAHMEDRVRKIGGRLNIKSKLGRGACITADVYLEPILTTI